MNVGELKKALRDVPDDVEATISVDVSIYIGDNNADVNRRHKFRLDGPVVKAEHVVSRTMGEVTLDEFIISCEVEE
jgi:hypothetical protein